MDVALVGARAHALCAALGGGAQGYLQLRDVPRREWSLLALTGGAAGGSAAPPLFTFLALIPDGAPTRGVCAEQAVVYGFSPRATLTLSSTSMACLQRTLIAPSGALIEPQELPLPQEFLRFGTEEALALTLLQILCRS